jgi:P4 family phage/plasmid primase-like protien
MDTYITHTYLLDTALRLNAAGIVPLPVRTDGSKAPGLHTWKAYQETHPGVDELLSWFGGTMTDGIGVLTGAISGGLEMVELEGRAVQAGALEQLRTWAADNGAEDVLARVSQGYTEMTPSGGLHILYWVDGQVRRNTKLARTVDRQVLAESRGEGGFVVVAPSFGRSHPTGEPWEMRSGSIETIAVISEDERDLLWSLLSMLDEEPMRDALDAQQPVGGILGATAGLRPGDDYCERATWDEILTPHGWTKNARMGSGYSWRKPDKNGVGISATTGQSADGVDRLYVFSTSTAFEPERPYNKFSAYALLEHGGDYSAAAAALAAQGYGKAPQQSTVATSNARREYSDDSDDEHPALTRPDSTALSPATTLAQSEDGHSQAIISEYGQTIRYCHQMGRWLHWDGSRWEVQSHGGGIVREYAKAIARSYPDEKEWAIHKKRSLTSAGINGALTMSTTDFRVEIDVSALDAHPWELNTPAGIIDLRTGELLPSDPDRLHTKSTTVAPDFDADQSAWLEFLNTTFQGDQELIAYVQRLMGYACVGEVREAILPVFFGEGSNGKTVLLETVQNLLGDYATVAPQHFLVQGPSQHATEIAALAGVRFIIASETNEGQKFDEAKVKILTGGDSIKARFMRQDEFTFKPSHLLVMMTNHRPEVGSGGTSFWRRLREIPFLNQIPEDKRDGELQSRLIGQHGAAIMAWLATGAAQYAAHGLKEPDKVKVATKTYEASTDTVGRFVAEMCIIGGGEYVKVMTNIVRSAYELWCSQEGDVPVSTKAFTTQLMSRFGVGKSRDNKSRFYTNLSLVGGDDGDE